MDRKYNSSEDDAPLCPIHCNLYVGYVHLCALPSCLASLAVRRASSFPHVDVVSLDNDPISEKTRTQPTFPRSLSLIYDKHSAASHYFGAKSWNRPSNSRPTYRGPPGSKWLICVFAKWFRSSPPKSDVASESPSTGSGLPFLKCFFHGNQWCSARYTPVCRVYPLQSELRIPTYQSPP